VTIGKTQQTFEDLADEIVRHAVADSNPRPLHLIGHAYGQALARCVVARWPEVFASLTLLACGGSMPSDDILASARAATDVALAARDPDQHLRHVARAFFAPGNDATAWSTGWLTAEADVEMYVLMSTSSEHRLPVALPKTLVIQGIHDAIAPPQHGRAFQQINPAAELIELDGAGHAILPEQPETVARIVLDFLAANASS
jgi:pimeloyl-ACP methyl ester carboxylesterase